MRLGILCGLASEARILAGAKARSGAGLQIACGAARQSIAEEKIADLATQGVDALVSFGLAGALDPALAPGQLVLPQRVALPGGGRAPADDGLRAKLRRAADAESVMLHTADVAGTGAPALSVDAKRRLAAETGCGIVDMESHILAAECGRRGLPFLVLRAVADSADMEVPQAAVDAIDAEGRTRVASVLADLVRHPGHTGQYFHLMRAARRGHAGLRIGAGLLCRLGLEAAKA
jgi:adenosylhomocysteine nucleosidase